MTTPKKKPVPKKAPAKRAPVKKTAAKKPAATKKPRPLSAPSRITGEAPSKRLVARRKKTRQAPPGYFANPVGESTERKMKKGVELFEAFTGHDATHYDRVTLPDMSVCVQIGALEGIAYETTRDGKRQKYFHQFKKAARPIFAVTADGKAVVIVGGQFRFTERGIVDKGSTD